MLDMERRKATIHGNAVYYTVGQSDKGDSDNISPTVLIERGGVRKQSRLPSRKNELS